MAHKFVDMEAEEEFAKRYTEKEKPQTATLSDTRQKDVGQWWYWEEDVREFIKRIKEACKYHIDVDIRLKALLQQIDRLAGEKLTK